MRRGSPRPRSYAVNAHVHTAQTGPLPHTPMRVLDARIGARWRNRTPTWADDPSHFQSRVFSADGEQRARDWSGRRLAGSLSFLEMEKSCERTSRLVSENRSILRSPTTTWARPSPLWRTRRPHVCRPPVPHVSARHRRAPALASPALGGTRAHRPKVEHAGRASTHPRRGNSPPHRARWPS